MQTVTITLCHNDYETMQTEFYKLLRKFKFKLIYYECDDPADILLRVECRKKPDNLDITYFLDEKNSNMGLYEKFKLIQKIRNESLPEEVNKIRIIINFVDESEFSVEFIKFLIMSNIKIIPDDSSGHTGSKKGGLGRIRIDPRNPDIPILEASEREKIKLIKNIEQERQHQKES